MKIIDTHSHLNFSEFYKQRSELIESCLQEDLWMINVGTNFESSKKVVEIAESYEKGVYASIGLIPLNLKTALVEKEEGEKPEDLLEEEFDFEKYKKLASSKKVVAIGETGLDYFKKPKGKTKKEQFKQEQKELFKQHFKLAQEMKLPLILHCRMAHEEILDLLSDLLQNENIFPLPEPRGVIHCFTGNLEQAKRYIELGYYLGFNGIIFKLELEEIIKNIPIDKILVETDAPFLTPPDFYQDVNTPFGVKKVIEKIAEVKNISYEQACGTTFQNAKRVFSI